MNWQKIHDQIIDRAKDRKLNEYSENHHIKPRCLGGTDDSENLVRLTAREHFIIHKILCLIYPNENRLHWAAFMMSSCFGNSNQSRNYRISSSEYQRLKENLKLSEETKEKISNSKKGQRSRLGIKLSNESKEKISKSRKGQPSPRKGVKLTDEIKQKLSKSASLRENRPHTDETKKLMSDLWNKKIADGYESPLKGIPRDDEVKKKISISKTGSKRKPFSDEHLLKLSDALKWKAKGKIWITNGLISTMIFENEGIPNGWYKGMTRKNKTN